MIDTRGAVASFHCVMCEPCLRSRAYSSALRYAVDATETPCTPTPMRAPFIMRNICGMPWFSFASPPTGQPMHFPFSPKLRTHVADALMRPIEILGVGAVEEFHALGQRGRIGFDQEMVMIVHQAIGMAIPVMALHRMLQQGQELAAICVIGVNILPGIAPRGDMIKRSSKFDA